MPEGDTIHRTAAVLDRSLRGSVVHSARAQPGPLLRTVPDLSRLEGLRVEGVEARGKHLLMDFQDDAGHRLTLRTHMRMTGSWHRYRPDERWRLPERRATVVLRTDTAVAVCFDCPTVELLTDAGRTRSRPLRTLGPDVLSPSFETDGSLAADALGRLRAAGAAPIGEALQDQRLVAGIGNVVRNESMFLEATNPWTPVSALEPATLGRVVATARQILVRGAATGRRQTTGDPRPGHALFVYRRAGRPCRRCGTLIRFDRQGPLARDTYWCPTCQPAQRG